VEALRSLWEALFDGDSEEKVGCLVQIVDWGSRDGGAIVVLVSRGRPDHKPAGNKGDMDSIFCISLVNAHSE
jgi:hypothetical protein